MASVPSDPAHPLFEGLARAEVQRLRFERGDTGDNHLLELVLRHDGVLRTFRFEGVTNLRLQGRFPDVGWLQVFDVTGRQLDRLSIHVLDGEQNEAIEFWAASVDEIASSVA
jgi:hypothetical protein